ncbi:MAG: DNA-processing protein DprA [Clostridiales bacterium]|nr:DNA-processing protein DprA [Clostridiales bacterium]
MSLRGGTIIIEETVSEEIHLIHRESEGYPLRLRELSGMPKSLYYKGKLPADDQPTAAIVGARMCSPYGRIQAFAYAKFLSENGVQVISGMAIGIDSEGHKGALEGKTPTFAVLGNGVDICYPASNRRLYQRILRCGGGILSEFPTGMRAKPGFFPARNRVISGLADLVLVVEAKEKSGSLITASFALEQGKAVYALPGAVNDALSRGCHKLIYDGAGIAYSPEILLAEWGIVPEESGPGLEKSNLGLETDLNLVYSCLDLRPKSVDNIISETGLPPGRAGSLLTELTLLGLARETGRQYYVRQQGAAAKFP